MRHNSGREKALLDRISAARMHLPPWVALADSSAPATLRHKLRFLGIANDEPHAKTVLELVDQAGANRMLAGQSISTRYAAVERIIKGRRVWR